MLAFTASQFLPIVTVKAHAEPGPGAVDRRGLVPLCVRLLFAWGFVYVSAICQWKSTLADSTPLPPSSPLGPSRWYGRTHSALAGVSKAFRISPAILSWECQATRHLKSCRYSLGMGKPSQAFVILSHCILRRNHGMVAIGLKNQVLQCFCGRKKESCCSFTSHLKRHVVMVEVTIVALKDYIDV